MAVHMKEISRQSSLLLTTKDNFMQTTQLLVRAAETISKKLEMAISGIQFEDGSGYKFNYHCVGGNWAFMDLGKEWQKEVLGEETYYSVKVKITSDSGVGGYTELKTIVNCTLKDNEFWLNGKKLKAIYHTGFVDCTIEFTDIEKQQLYIRVN